MFALLPVPAVVVPAHARGRGGEQITAASLCHPPTRNGTISSDEIFTTAGGMNELSIPNYLVWWFMAAQKHDNV